METAAVALVAPAFLLSVVLTRVMIWLAPKLNFVDQPGGRKIHANPKPLGGGVAIFLSIVIPMLAGLAGAYFLRIDSIDLALIEGARQQTPLALTLLGCMTILHIVGLIDDRRALGPYLKLVVQLGVAGVLVIGFPEMRALTALGTTPSIILTILWIAGITNAFNFLDNMDGLSAGVAAVCTTAFLITTLTIGQYFVAATLALLLGALLGFLVWNFSPAKIFMGDSGSLLIGFLLGVLTIRTTFLPPGVEWGAGWYAVFAPLIVLALPLYDLIVVSAIRIRRGKSPFVGDTNHFSHRLVARGMSKRTAVLCLYLITAATSVAAILLPQVRSTFGAMLIVGQTLLILGVVALLEQHPLKNEPQTNTDQHK